ncbi:Ctf8-domain-containing protein [Amylocystis lapponica]|nr:Ctf8-domain-containing protein [Amylocystis lapponica]
MIISINIPILDPSSSRPTLPPQLIPFGSDEVVLIELQGTLEVEGVKEGQTVGKLSVDTATKKSTLFIGHHLLEGKLVKLPKPLAVLHRPTQDSTDQMDLSTSQRTESQVEWDVVTVVRHKIVFSKRPMPMVNKTPEFPLDAPPVGNKRKG